MHFSSSNQQLVLYSYCEIVDSEASTGFSDQVNLTNYPLWIWKYFGKKMLYNVLFYYKYRLYDVNRKGLTDLLFSGLCDQKYTEDGRPDFQTENWQSFVMK